MKRIALLAAPAVALLLLIAAVAFPTADAAPSRLVGPDPEAPKQGSLTGSPLLLALNNTFTFYLKGENLPQIQSANVQLSHPKFTQFEVTEVKMAKQGESFVGVRITAKFTMAAPPAVECNEAAGPAPELADDELTITIDNVTDGMNVRKMLTDTVQSFQ